jgi:hypothetical protein
MRAGPIEQRLRLTSDACQMLDATERLPAEEREAFSPVRVRA